MSLISYRHLVELNGYGIKQTETPFTFPTSEFSPSPNGNLINNLKLNITLQ